MTRLPTPRRRRYRVAAGAALFAALLVATVVVWLLALGEMPMPGFEWSVAEVEALIQSWGVWGMAASVMLMVLHSFVPFPAEMVAIANGMLYGPLLGTALTWTGAMLGAWLAFGLAKLLGRPFVLTVLAERHHAAIDRWAERQGIGALIVARLIPVISFNLINYAAGLTSISWWTFTWATGLGILPLTTLMVVMGDRLWSGDWGPWLWVVLAGVLAGVVWWAVRRRPGAGSAQTGQK